MFSKVICPISSARIDSHVSRLTVFINVLFMGYFLFTLEPLAVYIVALDYGIRALGHNRYSPICFIASLLINVLGIKPKMIDKAPKIFASRLGFICAILGAVFITFGMPVPAIFAIGFFALLATLDAVFDQCVGCMIYNYIVLPFYHKA
jgi:hypothetical protein